MAAERLVFVSGLHHSGTTAAGVLLAQRHDGLVVGESEGVFGGRVATKERTHEVCSCGAAMRSCPFWGEYYRHDWSDELEKHLWLLERGRVLGFGTVVDTSKHAPSLAQWLRTPAQVSVVYMIRSPAAWAASMRAIRRRTGHRAAPRLYYLLQWHAANARRRRHIAHLIPSMEVMCGDAITIAPGPVAHHIAFGNRCKYVLDMDGGSSERQATSTSASVSASG